MTVFQRNVIALIKNALSYEKVNIEEPVDWEKVYAVAKQQNIVSLIYCAIVNLKLNVPEDILKKFQNSSFNTVFFSELKGREYQGLYDTFEQRGIDYMLLKGINLQKLYPKNVVRYMKDADVLIKEVQYPEIKEIMQELGFRQQGESPHEYIWVKDSVMVELHKAISSPYNKDYYGYFGDGWKFAVRKSGHLFNLPKEQELAFLVAHFTGHYRRSGIGIFHFTDFYVYLKHNSDIDTDKLNEALDAMGLLKFYKNILNTLGAWFEGREGDKATELITSKLFSIGKTDSKAKLENIYAAAKAQRRFKNKRVARLYGVIRKIFPEYKAMNIRHPILKKVPVLLPIFWIVRWVDLIVFHRDRIKQSNRQQRLLKEQSINQYLNELHTVGLDIEE